MIGTVHRQLMHMQNIHQIQGSLHNSKRLPAAGNRLRGAVVGSVHIVISAARKHFEKEQIHWPSPLPHKPKPLGGKAEAEKVMSSDRSESLL